MGIAVNVQVAQGPSDRQVRVSFGQLRKAQGSGVLLHDYGMMGTVQKVLPDSNARAPKKAVFAELDSSTHFTSQNQVCSSSIAQECGRGDRREALDKSTASKWLAAGHGLNTTDKLSSRSRLGAPQTPSGRQHRHRLMKEVCTTVSRPTSSKLVVLPCCNLGQIKNR